MTVKPVQPHDEPSPRITAARLALMITIAVLASVITGVLAYLDRRSLPECLMSAGAAGGAALGLVNQLTSGR